MAGGTGNIQDLGNRKTHWCDCSPDNGSSIEKRRQSNNSERIAGARIYAIDRSEDWMHY
jgi:hypothetical protein